MRAPIWQRVPSQVAFPADASVRKNVWAYSHLWQRRQQEALENATLQFHWGLGAPAGMDHLLDIDLGLGAVALAELRRKAVPELDMRTRTDP